MSKALDLRTEMPFTTSAIEALREVFGVAEINQVIRSGMNGTPGFYALENGHECGTRPVPARQEISAAQMVIIAPTKETKK